MRNLWAHCLLVGVLTLTATGCWDHVPVEEAAFVLMLGIDRDPREPGDIVLTQMIALPTALTGGGGDLMGGGRGQVPGTPFYLISSRSSTLQTAQLQTQSHVPRFLENDHSRGLVFGEDFARSGVDGVLSWALRHPEIRPFVSVLVTRGPAQPFLDSRPALEPLPGNALLGLIRRIDAAGLAFNVPLYEFARKVLSPRSDAVAPLVERIDPLQNPIPSDFQQQPVAGQDPPTQPPDAPRRFEIRIAGLAVFKGARLVGFLEEAEARGAAWIFGRSLGAVAVAHPAVAGRHVGISLVRVRSRLEPEVSGDRLRIRIRLDASADVLETGELQSISAGRWISQLEAAAESAMAQEVRMAVKRLQDLRADIFESAEELYRRSPRDWRRLADRWDEVYAGADVDVQVRVEVHRTGLSR